MRSILIAITALVIITVYSCKKTPTEVPNCASKNTGEVQANGSYLNLEENGISFVYGLSKNVSNNKLITDSSKIIITIQRGGENCLGLVNFLSLRNLNINEYSDTIKLHNRSSIPDNDIFDLPYASMSFLDFDAVIETYNLDDAADNWILIDSVNADTTEIAGQFNLSLITNREAYLSGERERWDDPNRPDTLHYTNGVFRAGRIVQ